MLPWLGPWGSGQEEATEESGLSTSSDHGGDWSSGEEATEEPGAPVQDSPQPQALSPSETGRKLPEESCRWAPIIWLLSRPRKPQVTSQVTPSRMTPLPLLDPGPEANARPQLVGASCGSGVSLSGRTLCHPSWPMYDVWGRIPTSGHPEEEQVSKDTGLPVTNYEDVFLLDPLLVLEAAYSPVPVQAPSAGSGLSEAAAPTCHHVPLWAPLLISGLLFHLAKRGRDNLPHWSAADEPGRAEL